MKPKLIEIDYIPILFEKSRRAKRLIISVKPGMAVRVAVPEGVSLKLAKKYVKLKISWIKKSLKKIKIDEQRHELINKNNNLDKKKSREKLITRLDFLAKKHNFTYNRIFIRNQKTRWGSCSNKNNINLNIKLAKLPDELMDYVILHELVHTIVRNHSPKFWNELEKYVKNSKIIDSKLKEFNLLLL